MDKKVSELLAAAKDLDAIYVYWWDRADKPHIMLMDSGIAKFEKAHDRLGKAIRAIEKQTKDAVK